MYRPTQTRDGQHGKVTEMFTATVILKTGRVVSNVKVERECPYGTIRHFVFGVGGGAHRTYVRFCNEKFCWLEI
jgi:hypothetical protein